MYKNILIPTDGSELSKLARLSIPLRAEAATQYKWRHMDDAGYRRFCSAAKPSRC